MDEPPSPNPPPLPSSASSPALAPPSPSRFASSHRERQESATLHLKRRRQSVQERINEILETARERADSLEANSANTSPRLQPLLGNSPRGGTYSTLSRGSSPRGRVTYEGENGVVTSPPVRQHAPDYQSLAYSGGTTRRRSAQSRRPSGQDAAGFGDAHVNGRDGEQDAPPRPKEGWLKKKLRYFQSIELENKGSVARDHLALERTFLAWLRTSLAFASIGIAITQLFRLNTSLADTETSDTLRALGKPLGSTFLGISILILFLGYNRYLEAQHWVIKGKFPASRGTIMLVSFIAFAVTVASLIVVVAVGSG